MPGQHRGPGGKPTLDLTGIRIRPAWPWFLIGIWAAADQATKAAVTAAIPRYTAVELVPGLLNLVHVGNRGVAFGLLDSGSPWVLALLIAVAVAVIAALGLWLVRLGPGSNGTRLALALILGGAIGNLIDRVRLGYVVDFVDVHWWNVYHYPAFNVADTGITLGAALLIYLLVREELGGRSSGSRA